MAKSPKQPTPDILLPEPGSNEEMVKNKYGFLPTSIWDLTKSQRWTDLIRDWGDPTGKKRQKGKGQQVDIKFSEFNPDVADRIVRLWSEMGDTIVDPFGGRATRAVVSGVLGRHYTGFEIAPSTHALTEERIEQVETAMVQDLMNDWVRPKVVLGDGVKMKEVDDNSADLIMTCPPYWDVEKYESVAGQLSDCGQYRDFMQFIAECLLRCKQVLKPGKFMVWVVADMRRKGKLVPFHYDLVRIAMKMGFSLHDEIIMKNRSPFARFIGPAIKNHHTAKVHEYILCFKLPKK